MRVLFLVLIFLPACAREAPGSPSVLRWTADTIRLIGGEETGPASFYRVRQALVDVDDRGNIYVLNPATRAVAVFDSSGRLVWAAGREGAGPGELRSPISISAMATGEALVHDLGRGRLVTLRPTGAPTEVDYPYGIVHNQFRHVEATSTGLAIWIRDPFAGSDERFDRLTWSAGPDTVQLVTGRPAYRSTAHYPACGFTFTVRLPLSPDLHWAQVGDRIAVTSTSEYVVEVFDHGRPVRRIRGPVQPEQLSEDEAIAYLEQVGYVGPCNTTPREHVRKHGFHAVPQLVRDVALAPNGELWVARVADGLRVIDVFTSDGTLLGTLKPEFPWPVAFLPDGRLLAAVTDSLDVQRLAWVVVVR